ncbi:hypothetical protein KVT40_004645 [Elsinoe batatas]|uniref:RBR-type E3 ubiquitin transferase n=1 Tax=Elsinoe batatas TaxID=2601811 RepID=A0A8K0L143_9PEZI|nr:hypothetical protein KVT40_004645 [Elsinoe batatas]
MSDQVLINSEPVDRETAIAVLESQLQDINEIQPLPAGPSTLDLPTDALASLEIHRKEIVNQLDAIQSGVSTTESQEVIVNIDNTPRPSAGSDVEEPMDDKKKGYTGHVAPAEPQHEENDECGPLHCVFCEQLVKVEHGVTGSCGHQWCKACLEDLFQKATIDETLYPPRCCGERIMAEEVKSVLSGVTVQAYTAKVPEWETKNRVYCCMHSCAAWIPPSQVHNGVGTCLSCGTGTCITCKHQAHVDRDCPEDESVRKLLDLALDRGWQKCPECNRMVQISTGCNHMVCLCKTEFCYKCGEIWKTCDCAQWQEEHLMERPEAI